MPPCKPSTEGKQVQTHAPQSWQLLMHFDTVVSALPKGRRGAEGTHFDENIPSLCDPKHAVLNLGVHCLQCECVRMRTAYGAYMKDPNECMRHKQECSMENTTCTFHCGQAALGNAQKQGGDTQVALPMGRESSEPSC
eukprot:1159779-Pelagomonas_calceolata.AAC.3